jgi:huntingtin interacting protein 1
MNRTREQDTGVKLEVNDKILDACTGLMKAIKLLIIKAKELQKEIAAQGRVWLQLFDKFAIQIFVQYFLKGTSTVKEFYSKNHKWTEGLVTAAKLVGLGANVLM